MNLLVPTLSFAPPDANGELGRPKLEPSLLEVNELTLQYKSGNQTVTAAWRVSFKLEHSDRLVLLGPSGCGKSTILKAIGGFVRPSQGTLSVRGQQVTKPGPDRVVVFQEFEQLLPWKTVKQNVVFALESSGRMRAQEARAQAQLYLRKVGLEKFAGAYPHTLSGGMKQRVAIARCLAMNPEIILMDEPFAALDALTRAKMQQELLRLWTESRFTMLFVTHSINEALLLGNRIILLSGSPAQVRAELTTHFDVPPDERSPEFADLHERLQQLVFEEQPESIV